MADSADFFRSLEGWLAPEKLLRNPAASGAGVRVAVIDSGVDVALLTERFRKRGQEIEPIESALFRTDEPAPQPDSAEQSSPHGTVVADIIFTLAPRAKLYSANVFGSAGACEVETVIRAIDHAIHVWKVKVINLSLGVPESQMRQLPKRHDLLKAVESAYYRDVLVFAAAHNDHPVTRSYPSLFAPPLISVDKGGGVDPMQFAYQLRENVEFSAYAKGYLGPFARESATSWATPHLAAIAAKLLSLHPEMKPFEIKTLLYWLAKMAEGKPAGESS